MAKTEGIDLIQDWVSVLHDTVIPTSVQNVAGNYDYVLGIEVASSSVAAKDTGGLEVIVLWTSEASVEEHWQELLRFRMVDLQAVMNNVRAESASGQKVLNIDDAQGNDLADFAFASFIFIKDTTIGDSELGMVKERDADPGSENLTLVHNLTTTHADTADVYSEADKQNVHIPFVAKRVMVVFNNDDGSEDFYAKVTGGKVPTVS